MTRTVAVYRDRLLPYSETFIANQIGAMQRYRPHAVGAVALAGQTLPIERANTISPAGPDAALAAFYATRRSSFLEGRIKRLGASLIHAHFAVDAVQIEPTARRLGLPLVTTVHGYDLLARERLQNVRNHFELRALVARRSYRKRLGPIVAVSDYVADHARNIGLTDVTRIYIGVDTETFQPDESAVRSGVVFVGRLIDIKGCRDLIAAMARLVDPPKLTMIGDGPLRAELEAHAASVRLDVDFLGAQPPAVVIRHVQNADVLCVPSKTAPSGHAEALGTVFAEAQACGTPVVATKIGGIPEVVADQKSGILVPEGEVAALAEALDTILRDDSRRADMGAYGASFVAMNHNLDVQTAKLEDFYDGVLS